MSITPSDVITNGRFQGSPKNNKEYVVSLFEVPPIALVWFHCRLLLSVEDASIHALIDTWAFRSHNLPCWRLSFWGLSIDPAWNVFSAYCEIAGCDIGLMLAVELFCKSVCCGLQIHIIIICTFDIGRVIGRRKLEVGFRGESLVGMEEDEAEYEGDEGNASEDVDEEEPCYRSHRNLKVEHAHLLSPLGKQRRALEGQASKVSFKA